MMPKTLWMYWHEGYDRAPNIVQTCMDSWKKHHPGWTIHILDADTVRQYIRYRIPPHKLASLNQKKIANLLRLQLLHAYGGVWADATSLCRKPIDAWLPANSGAGFFVFHRPAPDRLLSTWFIAAAQGNRLIEKWMNAYARYFTDHSFMRESTVTKGLESLLALRLNRSIESARYWMSPFVTRILRIYPYFISHYLFEQVLRSDPECRQIWNDMPRVSADASHMILNAGYYAPVTEEIREQLNTCDAPVFKLAWNVDRKRFMPGTLMHDVLEDAASRLQAPDTGNPVKY